VPLALAFSLAKDFQHRQLIIEMTLGMVLFTLLFQGTTIQLLLKLLRLDTPTLLDRVSRLEALLEAIRKGRGHLDEMKRRGLFSDKAIETARSEIDKKAASLNAEFERLAREPEFQEEAVRGILWTQAVSVCHKTYSNFFEERLISESVLREIVAETTLAQDRIQSGFRVLPIIETLPLEKRVQCAILRILERKTPDPRRRSRFHRRLAQTVLTTRFELFTAQYVAALRTGNMLDTLSEIGHFGSGPVEECRVFFRKHARECLGKLEALYRDEPELMTSLEIKTLQRTSLSVERKTILELGDHGGIPESVARELVEQV
jgi:CPA1 family monovalent cation:H+ antiporter